MSNDHLPAETVTACSHKRVQFPSEGQEHWHVPCPWCLRDALEKIANGDGYYGEQAREYKQIAKDALRRAGRAK